MKLSGVYESVLSEVDCEGDFSDVNKVLLAQH